MGGSFDVCLLPLDVYLLSLLLQVVTPWFPSHLAALRTMKAEVAVGLREGQAAALQAEDPDWWTSGDDPPNMRFPPARPKLQC